LGGKSTAGSTQKGTGKREGGVDYNAGTGDGTKKSLVQDMIDGRRNWARRPRNPSRGIFFPEIAGAAAKKGGVKKRARRGSQGLTDKTTDATGPRSKPKKHHLKKTKERGKGEKKEKRCWGLGDACGQ